MKFVFTVFRTVATKLSYITLVASILLDHLDFDMGNEYYPYRLSQWLLRWPLKKEKMKHVKVSFGVMVIANFNRINIDFKSASIVKWRLER